jgi:hypothetical protein
MTRADILLNTASAVISGKQADWNEEAAAWRAGSHTIAMAQEASPAMPLHPMNTQSI